MLRLMVDNYERGLYEGEEYQYWQKVNALKEKLDLLSRLPEPAIERAARTLLDLRESWEWATKEERMDLARMMIQEVGVVVAAKRVIWINARPDFDVLFQLLNNLRVDEQRRFWIVYREADEDACDIREDLGQEGMETKIAFPISHNNLTITEGDILMMGKRLTNEIAQRELSGLCRKPRSVRTISPNDRG